MADPAPAEARTPAARPREVAAWAAYDLANTLFSFVVLSFYFGPWLTENLGAPDSAVTVPESLSMLLAVLLSPFLGALSDRRGRKPFLAASTLVAATATALLGLGAVLPLPHGTSLMLIAFTFGLANLGFQLALVFYDALLPSVATPETIGRVGALGVGVGYLGSFAGLAAGTLVLRANPEGEPLLFLLTGLGFLLFAIPCFLLVRDRRPAAPPTGQGTHRTLHAVLRTIRAIPSEGRLARFLLARLLYADAVNTLILVLGIYVVGEIGFRAESTEYALLLALGILASVLTAPLWGLLADRLGPKHTLDIVLLLWVLILLVVALHPVLDLPRDLFYLVSAFTGAALAGTWTADRPLLVGLAPPDRVGEWFGLYAMAGRFAAVTGPLLWSLTVDVLFPGKRPVGVFVLLGMVLAAWIVLRKLPDPKHPAASPLDAFIPWRDGTGRPRPRLRAIPRAAPFLVAFLTLSWVLFLQMAHPSEREWVVEDEALAPYAYRIPDLTRDFPHALLTFLVTPFLNAGSIQLVYVTLLLLLIGIPFEVKEGPLRTLIVFFGTSFAAGLVAGGLLRVLLLLDPTDPLLSYTWTRLWTGGSAGAFGLMGALAARARRPSLLLALFTLWEINVGWWYLRSYTPAFHLTALATGFLATRYLLPPPRARASAPGRTQNGDNHEPR